MASPSAVGAALAHLHASTSMTWAQIADTIGASSGDYVRKVATGHKPGRNLEHALDQYATRGRVTEPPLRRRAAGGGIARVRAAGPGKSRQPTDRDLRAYRGKFSVTSQATARGRIVTVTAPRTEGVGRERARAEIGQHIAAAGRATERVSFVIEFANGDRVKLGDKGGYDAAMTKRRLRVGEDVFEWLASQCEGSKYFRGDPGPVVEVSIVIG